MRVLSFGAKQRGNSLMEYAVPAAIILLTVGVLSTFLDIQGLMGQYFSAASGHTRSDMQGSTLNVTLNSANLAGQTGTGASGFDERIIITDGNGRRVQVGAGAAGHGQRGGVGGTNGTTNQEERDQLANPLEIVNPESQGSEFAQNALSGNSDDVAFDKLEPGGSKALNAMDEAGYAGQGDLVRPEVSGTRGSGTDVTTQKF